MTLVERNFILKKGERTVGVEANPELNDIVELLKRALEKIPTHGGLDKDKNVRGSN